MKASWTKLDLPGSPYYPRATQLRDGRILVIGHIGGDDEYGKVNQTIFGRVFRLGYIKSSNLIQAERGRTPER